MRVLHATVWTMRTLGLVKSGRESRDQCPGCTNSQFKVLLATAPAKPTTISAMRAVIEIFTQFFFFFGDGAAG